MKPWDDIETVRVALRVGRAEQLARELRHDKHGEVLLALTPEERGVLFAAAQLACTKALRWARMLEMAGRLEEAFTLLDELATRVDVTEEALRVAERLRSGGRAPSPARMRVVIELAVPRIADSLSLARPVVAAACSMGDLELALAAVRVGVRNGLDVGELEADPACAALVSDPRFAAAGGDPFPPGNSLAAPDLDALERAWTVVGRAHLTAHHQKLLAIYEQGQEAAIDPDPRGHALADAVIDAVVALRGQPGAARARLDPACGPLAHRHPPRAGLPICFATILGPDDVLVRAGPSYEPVRVLRLRGGLAEPVSGVAAVTANRAHTLLALARPRLGIEVRASMEGPVIGTFAWPDVRVLATDAKRELGPLRIEQLALSGDGTRLLVVGFRQGVFLASLRAGEPSWRYLGGAGADMLHGDLSDDGTRLVHGSQGTRHELVAIDDDGTLRPHASVGPRGEYPHFARFTDDGRRVALNACHLYQGATGCFDVEEGVGIDTDHYAETPHLRVVDGSLRVYAGAWLPRDATRWLGIDDEALALMGPSVLRVVSSTGQLLVAHALGASGASADYHPGLGLLAIGTYAGQLHVLSTDRGASIGTEDGWARGGGAGLHEIRRWLLWRDLPGGPVAW